MLRFFLLLWISYSLVISCSNTTPSASSIETSHFTNLPPLASYINELGLSATFEDPSDGAKLFLENNQVVLFENSYDETDLDSFSTSYASFSGSSSGTSGGSQWTSSYKLLQDGNEPIVLCLESLTGASWGSMSDHEIMEENLDYLIEEKSIPEEKAILIAEKMALRDNLGQTSSISGKSIDMKETHINVYQKKDNKWLNINSEVFAKDMPQQFESLFPFIKINSNTERFSFDEVFIKKTVLEANKTNWLNWFGTENIQDITLNTYLEGSNIIFEISPKKRIHWQWSDAGAYTLKGLPEKTEFMNEVCQNISASAERPYTFKGEIDKQYAIEMEISFTKNEKKIEAKGNYWYSSKPNSKFPIQGFFPINTNYNGRLLRLKDGAQREVFDFEISNCRLEGYWQHLGSMEIATFNAALVL